MAQTYYQILGVLESASNAQIKAAYRKMASLYHPDRNGHRVAWANQMMQRINEAYNVLSDDHRRAAYDDELRQEAARRAQEQAEDTASHWAHMDAQQRAEEAHKQAKREKRENAWYRRFYRQYALKHQALMAYLRRKGRAYFYVGDLLFTGIRLVAAYALFFAIMTFIINPVVDLFRSNKEPPVAQKGVEVETRPPLFELGKATEIPDLELELAKRRFLARPQENRYSHHLFEVKKIKESLIKTMGMSSFANLVGSMGVTTPVEIYDSRFMLVEGCTPHSCDTRFSILVLDVQTDSYLWVQFFEGMVMGHSKNSNILEEDERWARRTVQRIVNQALKDRQRRMIPTDDVDSWEFDRVEYLQTK